MEPEAYTELNQQEPGHWWYRGMRQITEGLLEPFLGRAGQLDILDAGCGAGGNLTALAKFGCAVGIDYSPLALAYARVNHSSRIARATIEALPYADRSFDVVTSFDVLYCQEVEDDTKALREFARVTRVGGHVLIRVPALPALRGPHDTVVHGARRYTAGELDKKMRRAGLLPLRFTYANSILMPLIFIIRKLQNLGVGLGSAPRSDVSQTPEPINRLLTVLLKLEARWLRSGHNFLAGVSLFGLAVKPTQSGSYSECLTNDLASARSFPRTTTEARLPVW